MYNYQNSNNYVCMFYDEKWLNAMLIFIMLNIFQAGVYAVLY